MSRIVNLANSKNLTVCFVCDQKVANDRINLASSLSSHSKVTLPEKISQLIGDDYVVAVTEQDCVCKRCHSLLNHMDKLENELTLVKRALTTNISQKYKINFDGTTIQVPQQPLSNGLKTDSASDYEDDNRKNNADVSTTSPALVKKKVPPPAKLPPTPKPVKPAENLPKLKIYKCGFCSYQSKELGNVRLHMKIHIRANKPDGSDGDKSNLSISSPLIPPKASAPVRRRVFRCQVCSASFDDRDKCLAHISRDHTAAGRKLVEQKQNQADQPSQTTTNADTSSESTSRVNAPDSEQSATVTDPPAASETTENNETTTQKDGFEGLNNQEEMDTSEPPAIALYSCDSCPSNFNNDVDFASHANAHSETKDEEMPISGTKESAEENEAEKTEQSEFTEIPSQVDSQTTNEEEAPKDPNFGMDIEAMIAALHSEGPESNTESMPNI